LKFLLDVNIGTSIARELVANGHEVVRAALAYPTWEDADLLALAVLESWAIISEDGDFTDLIFSFGAPPPASLIFIRRETENQNSFVGRVIEIAANDRLIGNVVVLTPSLTRYRPFPKTDSSHD
jgi:predicted nuclease of predicted toxin-antitoxin system